MKKHRKIVILGDSAFAEVAYEYFTHDSEYEVVGFSVEQDYLTKATLFNLPVVPFEQIEDIFSPTEVEFYAAFVYSQMNRLRTRIYKEAKQKGYKPASYISRKAFVWPNVRVGEHCFIFEDNTLQPFVEIGDNVVLWSGNHIGHHSSIGANCFLASHVVVSGFCNIGPNCFLGVNATLANNIEVAEDNWIGPGITVSQNTGAAQLFGNKQPESSRVSTLRFFKVKA